MLLQKNPPAAGNFLTYSLHLLFSFHTIRRGEFKRIDLSALVRICSGLGLGLLVNSQIVADPCLLPVGVQRHTLSVANGMCVLSSFTSYT